MAHISCCWTHARPVSLGPPLDEQGGAGQDEASGSRYAKKAEEAIQLLERAAGFFVARADEALSRDSAAGGGGEGGTEEVSNPTNGRLPS